jgi:hypothetical protein
MKTLTLLLFMVLTSCVCFAQCGKDVILTSSKTDYLDATGTLLKSADEAVTISIDKSTIRVEINKDPEIKATLTTDSCVWKTPFKDGLSVIKGLIDDGQGNKDHLTVTITGTNGNIILLFEIQEIPDDRIRVVADKFEEKR